MTGEPAVRRRPLLAALCALVALSSLVPAASADDTRKKQEILFPELPARSVGDAPFALAARATSGLPVTLEVISGPAVIEGKTLRLTNVPGLVIVRASQGGNALFLPATATERAFAVNGKPSAPAITVQPAASRAGMGDIVILSVEATGEPKPAFQWRKNGSPIPGATESRLTLTSAGIADAGTYDVVISNSLGSVTSERATLEVGKRSQMITFQGTSNAMPGQSIMLIANASSGLPVRFDVVSGIAVISGSVLSSTQTGTVVVQASQGGDSSFDAASPVTQTFLFTAGPNGQHIP